MVRKTRKVTHNLSTDTLQKLVKKYQVTKSGSKHDVDLRLWNLRKHLMTLSELQNIENFLMLPPSKRFTGTRYGLRKNGSVYCKSKDKRLCF